MKTTKLMTAASMAIFCVGVAGSVLADSKAEIDADVISTMQKFDAMSTSHKALGGKATGMLIFPHVTKGGLGVAGEYGEGVLRVNGKTVDYYSVGSASVGLTAGIGRHSEIIMFMTKDSLDKFIQSKGWSIGADAGITVVKQGDSSEYGSMTQQKPILGFLFAEKGLLGDLSLEGSKITKIKN
ncbi:MAG: lipid-binding SYLF domain-containing protein [Pseudomonadota bacterium]